MKYWLDINNNGEFRRRIAEQILTADVTKRTAINGGIVWVRIPTTEFENGVVPNDLLAEVNWDKGKTWDRYKHQQCVKWPARTYIAIDRTSKSKLDPRKNNGYRHYNDPIPNWLFWKWVDWAVSVGGVDYLFVDLPTVED